MIVNDFFSVLIYYYHRDFGSNAVTAFLLFHVEFEPIFGFELNLVLHKFEVLFQISEYITSRLRGSKILKLNVDQFYSTPPFFFLFKCSRLSIWNR